MTNSEKHTRDRLHAAAPDATARACRPMADYLFDEVLGVPVTDDDLRAAKAALAPLRDHPGRLGWAVRVFLEGGETLDDYTSAGDAIFHVARLGEPGAASLGKGEEGALPAQVISLLPRLRLAGGQLGGSQAGGDGQLPFPGVER